MVKVTWYKVTWHKVTWFISPVALEVTAFRDTVTKAVESKRLHDQLYPNVVQYEGMYEYDIIIIIIIIINYQSRLPC